MAAADFLRGDADASRALDITDPIVILGYLFVGKAAPSCLDAADVDDSGDLDISDPIRLLGYLFQGTAAPRPPFGACGPDPTVDPLGCAAFAPCPPSSGAPAPPSLEAPPSPTALARISLRGRTTAGFDVTIAGGAALAAATADGTGAFSVEVELQRNRLNRLFAAVTDLAGRKSAPAAVDVIQDGERPFLFIDEPQDGAELSDAAIVVAGRVADTHSGFMGLLVTVNGGAANVVSGLGTNGTFERTGVALALGDNTLTAVASDAVGNQTTRSITVRRIEVPAGVPRLRVVSGNSQRASIHRPLPAPVVVEVLAGDGSPLSDATVSFEVTRSDGRLARSAAEAPGGLVLETVTDAQGLARAFWTLGGDAGCGNNRLRATSAGAFGEARFCASAAPGPAVQINIGSGNSQRAEARAPAPEPLRAWVSDGCNGIGGVPVSFRVVRGGGKVNGQDAVIVPTSATGHASVAYVLGAEGGPEIVEATFTGNFRAPAVFQVFGLVRQPGGRTRFSGLILDNAGQPVAGVACGLAPEGGSLLETRSSPDGRFLFDDLPLAGPADLYLNGLTATAAGGVPKPPGSYPGLHYEIVLVPAAENSLGVPVLLPPLDPRNARLYSTSADTTLTVAGVDGLTMVIRAGSMRLPNRQPAPNGTVVALNQVHHDDVPMAMPDGAAPPFAWTLQPAGATFDPPVAITYPNMSALPPGAIAYFLTFNHETGRFEINASGQVSADGATITTDPGAGIRLAGWGCNCPPYSVTGECEDECGGGGGGQAAGQGAQAQETCDDPCEEAKEFLRQDCERVADTLAAGLNCQLACLAEAVCNPESPDWLRCTIIDYTEQRRRGMRGFAEEICAEIEQFTFGLDLPDLNITRTDLCFAVDGTFHHLANELLPTWRRKCNTLDRLEHTDFLLTELVPCLARNPEISPAFTALGALTVPIVASLLREYVLFSCDSTGEGGGAGAPPVKPRREDLFSPEIAAVSRLSVRAGDAFFVRVGEPVELQVTRTEPGGGVTDLTAASTGTRYLPLVPATDRSGRVLATVTADGLLTVDEAPSPFRAATMPFLVLVRNGDDLGIGQFAAEDVDTDGDEIVDSYEAHVGLDPGSGNGLVDDSDGDGLRDIDEAMLGVHPLQADTDGDGRDDGIEVSQGSDPRDPGSRLPELALPTLAPELASAGSRVCGAPDTLPTVIVGGQTVTASADGSFRIGNVSAADNFGTGGPGTSPDFLSDDFLRLTATFVRGCKTYYALGQPFQLVARERARLGGLLISDSPPLFPESIRLEPAAREVPVGGTLQLQVLGRLIDGSEIDMTRREAFTVYRTSNPRIATVSPDGLFTGHRQGAVFVTATNLGATAVKRIDVRGGAVRLTITGIVRGLDGNPVAGATVKALGVTMVTAADGSFTLEVEAEEGQSFRLLVSATVEGQRLRGRSAVLVVRDDVDINAGSIVLQPQADFLFSNPQLVAAGEPTAVRAGDLDGDGDEDIAVLDQGDNLYVSLNEGGFFAAPVAHAAAGDSGLALGDLDDDGAVDAVTADNLSPGAVNILLNMGDGSFSLPAPVAAGSRPRAVILSRLDGGSSLDAVVVNSRGTSVTFLSGVGDGTFESGIPFATGRFPSSVAAGDMDGDGDEDLVVAYESDLIPSLLRNGGDGGFEARVDFPEEIEGTRLALDDLDGDGDLDVASSNQIVGKGGLASLVAVAFNRGDGVPDGPALRLPTASFSVVPRLADLDGDGDVDIALGGLVEELTVIYNLGGRQFSPPETPFCVEGSTDLDIADIDGDGSPDLISAARDGAVGILLNDGAGQFAGDLRLGPDVTATSAVLADFDGGGRLDLATGAESGAVRIYDNLGAGGFSAPRSVAAVDVIIELAAFRLDADSSPDLAGVGVSRREFFTLRNDGEGGFGAPVFHDAGPGEVQALAAGDRNGDGRDDVTVSLLTARLAVETFLNDGAGGLTRSQPLALNFEPWALALARLNGDGETDVAVAGHIGLERGVLAVFLGQGNGLVPGARVEVGNYFQAVVAVDLDADGDTDLAASDQLAKSIFLYLNDGDGNLSAGPVLPAPGSIDLTAGDLDGDGDLDLVAGDYPSEGILFYRRDPGGTFAPPVSFGTGPLPLDVVLGDVDGDGRLDIVVSGLDGVSVLIRR